MKQLLTNLVPCSPGLREVRVKRGVRRLTLAAFGAALLALALAAPPAHAQRPTCRIIHPGAGRMTPGTGGTLNGYNYYDPYGTSRQAAFNIALYGQAMSQVPPYALGYNPYPSGAYYPPTWWGPWPPSPRVTTTPRSPIPDTWGAMRPSTSRRP
jgi:hypothetical protein